MPSPSNESSCQKPDCHCLGDCSDGCTASPMTKRLGDPTPKRFEVMQLETLSSVSMVTGVADCAGKFRLKQLLIESLVVVAVHSSFSSSTHC